MHDNEYFQHLLLILFYDLGNMTKNYTFCDFEVKKQNVEILETA